MDAVRKNASAGANAKVDSVLNRSMMQLLEHVEYRLITGGEDMEAIYRLRYRSYLRSGMCGPIASGMFEDRWDNLPNSYRFGVYCYGELVSTLRLHYISSEHPYSPSVDAYPEILIERLARGETFIDGTRFATDPDGAPAPGVLPFLTLRLAMVASRYFGQNSVLTPVKVEHSAFYARFFNAVQRTEGKVFPGVLTPIALFEIPSGENMRLTLERFPFFKSTPMEQRLMFANPAINRLTPLSILPTAKYYRDAA
ncbi:hypothetical protein [Mesorhizobium sp.]|uniref:N-acyl amino acid synthase FeeM domain-containing protein n=1 Tax=Mesorhizobium sp. TaxID=1871066 RepID=UPI000FE5A653|nr:hypothetical protein [Mesorhizobium sp.]RWK34122.1 MAG: hypothetical protein EOR46_28995 [Mesorhizobium sp.]RWK64032.1 MAG: hypothetical protein EOR54_29280 [Mesorhizobium sp.]RWK72577.1 MAG: hypothetical protein EOR50_28170 [Mesorhizobium sp.]RWK75556.1 MAG: hypothetical protein EOR51_31455 [Mesorhizobium sp.]RWL00741.1 MAG: hypothetical protein EOR55_27820 [Mesorhizobium sp.]